MSLRRIGRRLWNDERGRRLKQGKASSSKFFRQCSGCLLEEQISRPSVSTDSARVVDIIVMGMMLMLWAHRRSLMRHRHKRLRNPNQTSLNLLCCLEVCCGEVIPITARLEAGLRVSFPSPPCHVIWFIVSFLLPVVRCFQAVPFILRRKPFQRLK